MTRPISSLPLLCLCLGLAACAPNTSWDGSPAASHITVEDKPTIMILPATTSTADLNAAQRARLRQGLATARPGQTAAVDVQFPVTFDAEMAAPVLRALDDLGMPPQRIRVLPVASDGSARGGIVITVHSLSTSVAACDTFDTAAVLDERQLDDKHYSIGCVSANNLAVMLADPRDLTEPRHLAPDDGIVAIKPLREDEAAVLKKPLTSVSTTSQQ